MNPGRYNITVYTGTTFKLSPVWKIDNLPVNLTGYSAKMQVRDISGNLVIELATDSYGYITIDPAIGQINLELSANITADIIPGNYSYALNLQDSAGNVTQILQGAFTVTASVVQ